MTFEGLLQKMIELGAADLFITAGKAPSVKVNGALESVGDKSLDSETVKKIILSIMSDEQKQEFLDSHEVNFAIDSQTSGRFRVNCFMQKNEMGAVLRRIETEIPTLESLGLPPVLKELIMQKRGLILYVGGTGSGKSTSLAAMINYRNENSSGHILTVEDPVEFVHQHKGNIVTQREVGIDTDSFEVALKNALRQSPDVVLIGEIRSQEIMDRAIKFAETGHLCLATLHANNANQALDRVIGFFPPEHHDQLWLDLALDLRAIIGQRLVPTVDGKGRVPAVEVLINTPTIAENIKKGKVDGIKEFMEKGGEIGMQTFDQSLLNSYLEGKISYDNALKNADSENNLRLAIKFAKQQGKVPKPAPTPPPPPATTVKPAAEPIVKPTTATTPNAPPPPDAKPQVATTQPAAAPASLTTKPETNAQPAAKPIATTEQNPDTVKQDTAPAAIPNSNSTTQPAAKPENKSPTNTQPSEQPAAKPSITHQYTAGKANTAEQTPTASPAATISSQSTTVSTNTEQEKINPAISQEPKDTEPTQSQEENPAPNNEEKEEKKDSPLGGLKFKDD